MPKSRIRPTFSVHLTPQADEAMAELRSRLEGVDYADCTRSKGRCADFFVDEEERKLWSPHLSVQVEPDAEGSLLRGRFGPHPELWTLFIFLYTAVGFLAVIGLMLGFVQWQSGMDSWGLWGVWLGVPGLVVLYGISAMGQRLSAHQMEELRGRLERLVSGLEAEPPSAAHTGIDG
ncbi:MAG: hypothetical protein HKO65_12415 [Gemmatimonadetes bacterium]|nr:hypothetical protein [Gemmatimonadota bacterium]NNM05885.1 hypothetical protein [Gemmatimonadota bacterium]